ncbi:unnamed protein product [Sphenostylis stenocarpa]|uniref:Uncharacterized protein n=1 Tax=Sphenostylis stenocarpa TaxID=92480 RepID=A0AA86VLJ8_9FABA|nr:unnamed protein product [Sphenostylis stenocarpa]
MEVHPTTMVVCEYPKCYGGDSRMCGYYEDGLTVINGSGGVSAKQRAHRYPKCYELTRGGVGVMVVARGCMDTMMVVFFVVVKLLLLTMTKQVQSSATRTTDNFQWRLAVTTGGCRSLKIMYVIVQ